MEQDQLTNSFLLADILSSMERVADSDLIKNDNDDLYRTDLIVAFHHLSHLYRNLCDQKNANRKLH